MWVCRWEYWVIDNKWFVSWPYKSSSEAENEAVRLMESDSFEWSGNLCVVEVLWNYDDYWQSEEEHDD